MFSYTEEVIETEFRKCLEMVFSKEEIERISINIVDTISQEVSIDVHGMTCREAKRFINNIVNLSNRTCQITVIHGFRHGTSIKDMLWNNYANPHVCGMEPTRYNQGRTILTLS